MEYKRIFHQGKAQQLIIQHQIIDVEDIQITLYTPSRLYLGVCVRVLV